MLERYKIRSVRELAMRAGVSYAPMIRAKNAGKFPFPMGSALYWFFVAQYWQQGTIAARERAAVVAATFVREG